MINLAGPLLCATERFRKIRTYSTRTIDWNLCGSSSVCVCERERECVCVFFLQTLTTNGMTLMNGTPFHHNNIIVSMNDRNPYNLPPDESNSCFVTGIVVFCAKLSPSFALFTIQQQKQELNVNDGGGTTTNNNPTEQSSFHPLIFDVIVSRKKKKGSRDIAASGHLSSIVEEVERCQTHNIPVRVHGYQPYEKCTCVIDCQHSVMYCWNVNELQIPKQQQQQQQQQQQSSMVVVSSDSSPQNSHYPLNNICREVNDCNNVPPPTQLLPLSIPTKSKQQKKRRPGVKNRNRSVHFAELLVDIFGHETLKQQQQQQQQQQPPSSSSCGILDVAGGGAGGLSFELSLRRGFPCTTIDPRPIKYNKAQRNAINFRQHSRQLLYPGLNVSHRANVLYNRFAEEWQPMQIQTLFNDEFASSDQGNTMLRECVAVVGIHPDEASDDIIRLAMRYNKPWVICPCCVFPKTFIHRRLPDGREVKTYEDLCEYIKNMPGNVQEVTLGFEGRNKVYYSLPEGWKGAA